MKYDNLILYDWFSFTSKSHSAESLARLLGIDFSLFEVLSGVKGYQDRLYYDGINIHCGGRDEIWCEMSGHGCRAFETYGHGSWATLFEDILTDKDYHVTRLDVAFDDHVGIFDLDHMARQMDAGNFVSRFKYWEFQKSIKGVTLYHGSPSSNVRFRIYDKARERNREDEGHWVRFEIQMRDKNAYRFLDLMVLQSVGEVFAKTVNNYLRYVTPPPKGGDSNKSRWEMADFWYNFISVSEKLSLYVTPGVEYNFDNLERYVVDQAGAATAAYVKIVGIEAFICKCLEKLSATKNPAYGDLLCKYAPKEDLSDLDNIVKGRLLYFDSITGCVFEK